MKRICFVGNSHVAAVKQAVDALKESGTLDGAEVSIFGSNGASLKTAQVNGGIIASDDEFVQNNFQLTSGGLREVRIADYDDIYFLAGPSFFDYSLFQAASDIPVISSALAEEIMAHLLKLWPLRLAKDTARANANVRVAHIGVPFTSAENPTIKPLLAKFHDAQSSLSGRVEKMKALIERMAAEVSEGNFRVMGPPPAALEESGLFTQHAFCQGSVRLTPDMNLSHPTDDYGHMNAAYGRLLLEQSGAAAASPALPS